MTVVCNVQWVRSFKCVCVFLVGRELTAQIAENQQNLGEMDHLLKMKEDLEERVESLEKELSRKDRDMEVRSKTLHCVFLIMMCMFF